MGRPLRSGGRSRESPPSARAGGGRSSALFLLRMLTGLHCRWFDSNQSARAGCSSAGRACIPHPWSQNLSSSIPLFPSFTCSICECRRDSTVRFQRLPRGPQPNWRAASRQTGRRFLHLVSLSLPALSSANAVQDYIFERSRSLVRIQPAPPSGAVAQWSERENILAISSRIFFPVCHFSGLPSLPHLRPRMPARLHPDMIEVVGSTPTGSAPGAVAQR